MRRMVAAGLAATLAMGVVPDALAHRGSFPDPRDTPGGIDVRRARVRSAEGDVIVKVATHDELPGYGWLYVAFDSRGGPRRDRVAVVQWDTASGGWVERTLYGKGREVVGTVHAAMGEDALRVRFPRTWLRATKHVRWRVRTAFGYASGIVDHAPDVGWF